MKALIRCCLVAFALLAVPMLASVAPAAPPDHAGVASISIDVASVNEMYTIHTHYTGDLTMPEKSRDLFLGADVTVRRGTREKPEFQTITGTKMVSDTDLTDKEVKELRAQGVIRVPNDADRAAIDAAERTRESAERAERDEDGLSAEEISGMTKEELEEYMASNGIDVPEKGSGADGAVVKADLVKAVRKAQR